MSESDLRVIARAIWGPTATVEERALRVDGGASIALPATDTAAREVIELGRRHGLAMLLASVAIRRQPNGGPIAHVPAHRLWRCHLRERSGGRGVATGRPFLYAMVSCADIDAEFGHDCIHGPPPHDILVAIVRKYNAPAVFNALRGMVGYEAFPGTF